MYTDSELRNEIKEDIQASDKGGNPGQWSARKAQMMASRYKEEMHKRGEEPYTTDKSEKSESQKHLSHWTDEEWQTSDGKAEAKQEDGSMKRYLPKKAWQEMNEGEKREADEKKLSEGKGKQFVSNTDKAKDARKHASKSKKDEDVEEKDVDIEERNTRSKKPASAESNSNKNEKYGGQTDDSMIVEDAENDKEAFEAANEEEDSEMEEAVLSEGSDADEVDEEEDPLAEEDTAECEVDDGAQRASKKMKTNGGAKRVTRSMTEGDVDKKQTTTTKPASKKYEEPASTKLRSTRSSQGDSDSKDNAKGENKRVSSEKEKESQSSQSQSDDSDEEGKEGKGDNEHGQPASASRLPKEGQPVFWRSIQGWIEGTVLEIIRTNKSVDGIQAHASKSDPRIALKSSSSGKTAVHKPSAVYF